MEQEKLCADNKSADKKKADFAEEETEIGGLETQFQHDQKSAGFFRLAF